MAEDKNKKTINVKNIDPALLAKAKEKAQREQRPLNQVIRELLRDWVKQPSK